jgi:hypothetical protein
MEQIRIRTEDRYIHASDMCKVGGKYWSDYIRNKTTKQFLKVLSSETNIPTSDLVQSKGGGSYEERGTWVHPRVATHLAQWISPEFAVKVSKWIEQWREDENNDDEFVEALQNLKPFNNEQQEADIRDRLAEKLKGDTEVETNFGKADIITKDQIIEVKCASNWKHALGQVLAYSIDYPKYYSRIHLFDTEGIDLDMVRKACVTYNVIVTSE